MKKSLYSSFVIAPILVLFCFAQCKKEHTATTITLYDKPLATIQSYIQSKWQLQYGKGGICATCIQYYSNYFWTFTNNNRVEKSHNGAIIADTTISWIRDRGTYTNGDSTFIMSFFDKLGYPSNYVVDKIMNDTLILHENAADAVFYHFTKSN